MVVVNETKRGQLLALLEQCAHLNADVQPRTEQGYFTVTVPPPWNGPAKQKAQEMQNRIKKWSEQYDGSAESLVQFMRGYYHGETRKAALDMVYEKLLEWPAGCAQTLAAQEMQKFFELCGGLMIYEPRPRKEILTMVQTIVGGEAA